jgi:hypothetical protein
MFVKKLSVALKSILQSATGFKAPTTLPTDLYILMGEETSGRLITTPAEVVTKLA